MSLHHHINKHAVKWAQWPVPGMFHNVMVSTICTNRHVDFGFRKSHCKISTDKRSVIFPLLPNHTICTILWMLFGVLYLGDAIWSQNWILSHKLIPWIVGFWIKHSIIWILSQILELWIFVQACIHMDPPLSDLSTMGFWMEHSFHMDPPHSNPWIIGFWNTFIHIDPLALSNPWIVGFQIRFIHMHLPLLNSWVVGFLDHAFVHMDPLLSNTWIVGFWDQAFI